MRTKRTDKLKQAIIQLCYAGLDSWTLRSEILKCLRVALSIDAASFATTDPATLLFTGSVIDNCLEKMLPHLLENEFLQDDFNKFRWLVRSKLPVGVLSNATQGNLESSLRYRNILSPLALGDELRVTVMSSGACWGILCLYRIRPFFGPEDSAFIAELTPYLAVGLRRSLLTDIAHSTNTPDGPGVLILSDDLSVISFNASARHWLDELAENERSLPQPICTVVACLKESELRQSTYSEMMPKARFRTSSGQWLVVHASRLHTSGTDRAIAVIFELAQAPEITSIMMQAYDLTNRESEITQLVLRGLTTIEIAGSLQISPLTVQDHLKAIFDKVNVHSRRQLAVRIFAQQYQPRFTSHGTT